MDLEPQQKSHSFSAWLRGPVVGRNKGYEVEVWFTSGADATVRWFLWVAAYVG